MIRHLGVVILVLSAFTFGLAVAPSRAQDDAAKDAKEKKVRKLLKLTRQDKIAKETLEQMFVTMAQNPQLPPGFMVKLKAVAKVEDLIDITTNVYMEHLDDEPLDAAITFYETPGGKAFAKAAPAIAKASVEAGQTWGRDIAMKAAKALADDRKNGVKPKDDDDDDDDNKTPPKKDEKAPPKKEPEKSPPKKDGD